MKYEVTLHGVKGIETICEWCDNNVGKEYNDWKAVSYYSILDGSMHCTFTFKHEKDLFNFTIRWC